jgi:hypothetical protein
LHETPLRFFFAEFFALFAHGFTMTLQEERLAFYAAIGEAITEWSHVEDGLYMILQRCVAAPDHRTTAAAFYAVDAFRTRLAMTDAAVSYHFGQSHELQAHIPAWEKLYKAIDKRARKRNELAHHQVLVTANEPEKRRYTLIPALLDPHSPLDKKLDRPGLHISELQIRVKVFQLLSRRITDFILDIWKS